MSAALQLANRVLEGEDPKSFLKRVAPRKENTLQVGETVISGTGIVRDIMDACLYRLEQLDPAQYAAELEDSDVGAYREQGEAVQLPQFDPEYYTYEHLFNVMQKYCPPCSYFGSYEADGSIGCWPPDATAIDEMVDTEKLTYISDEQPEQGEAIRRGDYTGIHTRYVIVDWHNGPMELWDSQRHVKVWEF
jgi:hypothetical protein